MEDMYTQANYSLKEHHIILVDNAKAFIQVHFRDNISLDKISSYFHISSFHFCRIFKRSTNYSPYQYILTTRLNHAELLLRNTSQPITDICFASGFNSVEHFSTIFRAKFKKNPSQYRKASIIEASI